MTREEAIEAIKEAYGNSEYTAEIIRALEQIELNTNEDAIDIDVVIEWLKNKDIIKLFSQEEIARKELKELLSTSRRYE